MWSLNWIEKSLECFGIWCIAFQQAIKASDSVERSQSTLLKGFPFQIYSLYVISHHSKSYCSLKTALCLKARSNPVCDNKRGWLVKLPPWCTVCQWVSMLLFWPEQSWLCNDSWCLEEKRFGYPCASSSGMTESSSVTWTIFYKTLIALLWQTQQKYIWNSI